MKKKKRQSVTPTNQTVKKLTVKSGVKAGINRNLK